MKNRIFIFLTVTLMPFSCRMEPSKNVNPDSTKEARNLLNFLYEIQGNYTLSGQHNFIATGSKYTDTIKMITGKTPMVFGSDFSFSYKGDQPIRFQHCGPINIDDPGNLTSFEDLKTHTAHITDLTPEKARAALVKNAIEKYREGFIITLMWHCCPPGYGDHCDGGKIWAMDNRPSQAEWDELTTEGTGLNNAWKSQADVIAAYLKELQEAGVPVLWRPYHEMNGVWFWWCNQKGENGFRKLWIMMYDYYVNHHKLNNLIWVWNANAPRDREGDEAFAYEDFWPGSKYVDVLAADVYRADWKQSHHDDLLRLANGKPIAIGEAAPPPTPEILSKQNYWTWFMPWGNLVFWGKGTEILKELMKDERVLSKEDVTMDKNGVYHIIKNK
jgi:mannan endo-1,4-beta-mannosidase